MTYMHKVFFASLLILCCVPLAVAQANDRSRFEFFAGYSVMRINYKAELPNPLTPVIVAFAGKQTLNGFNASATINLTKGFGLTGDFSGHFKTTSIPDPLGVISRLTFASSTCWADHNIDSAATAESRRSYEPWPASLTRAQDWKFPALIVQID